MSSLPFDETDYRSALRKWVAERPNRGRGELKTMAEKLGVPSPVFSQILSGFRELTEDHAYVLSDHMGFTDTQRDYFLALVQLSRASHPDYKAHLKTKLSQIRNEAQGKTPEVDYEVSLTDIELAEFYSSWIYSAVYLSCVIRKNGLSLDDIGRELNLSRDHIIPVVQFLLKVRLLEIKNNSYRVGSAQLPSQPHGPYAFQHHRNWRLHALDRSQNLKPHELMYTSPLFLTDKEFTQIRTRLADFIREVAENPEAPESSVKKLACMNIDLFEVR